MELKEFIKGVLSDITESIKESQEELQNGSIINPTASKSEANCVAIDKRYYRLQEVQFDVLVVAGNESVSSANGGVNIKIASIGANGHDKTTEEKTSRIKFSIPIIYPSVYVEKYEHPDNYTVRGYTPYL